MKKIFLIASTLLFLANFRPAYSQINPDSGLVGYWSFNEGVGDTAYDYSGNENYGLLSGATWTTGICGNALSFDGTDDYITYGDILNDLYFPLTVSAWVYKRDSLRTAIFSSDDQNDYWGFRLLILNVHSVHATFYDGGDCNPWNRRSAFADSISVPIGEWTHVVMVIRGATDMNIYINGEDVSITYSGTGASMQHDSDPAKTAHEGQCGANNYSGDIVDELRIYNRTLSQEEIEFIYNQTPCEPIPTLSEWGMLIMGLLLLAAGTVAVVRRKTAVKRA